jgi:hypothetical protein
MRIDRFAVNVRSVPGCTFSAITGWSSTHTCSQLRSTMRVSTTRPRTGVGSGPGVGVEVASVGNAVCTTAGLLVAEVGGSEAEVEGGKSTLFANELY